MEIYVYQAVNWGLAIELYCSRPDGVKAAFGMDTFFFFFNGLIHVGQSVDFLDFESVMDER